MTVEVYVAEPVGARLAAELRDPSLQVSFWLPERRAFVDAAGSPVGAPREGRVVTRVECAGELVAVLDHATPLAPGSTEAVAAVGPALLAGRRAAQLGAELADVRASRARIVEGADAARSRTERVLHDGAQQRLLSVALVQRMAIERLDDPQAAGALLEEASTELSAALAELRELARSVYPVLLTDAGVGPALAALVERSPVPAVLDAAPERRFDSAIERACYFVVDEVLAGIRPAARAVVTVLDRGDTMVVEVRADGDPRRFQEIGDRVAACGGSVSVLRSSAGTRVRAVLPCA